MIEAALFWNEPNNKSHWAFQHEPAWRQFSERVKLAADAVAGENPAPTRVLGGISPIDPSFIEHMDRFGVLDRLDVVAEHGFAREWNSWRHNKAEGSSYYLHFQMSLLTSNSASVTSSSQPPRQEQEFIASQI